MRDTSRCLRVMVLFLASTLFPALTCRGGAVADDSANYVLTEDSLNKVLGSLNDLRAKGLPISVGVGSLASEIANLQKQPKVVKILKKRGLSVREFVLACKSAAQMREADKARDNWQKTLQDPDASPQAKLEATQKLGESLKTNLFTPDQMELIRRKMPDLESLLPATK